jgi:hypothetical protein
MARPAMSADKSAPQTGTPAQKSDTIFILSDDHFRFIVSDRNFLKNFA